jgi:deoxyribose-phosphate aldolase
MLEAIRDAAARGRIVGFKPAGGIRTAADARAWVALVRDALGEAWVRPDRLRIGASALLDDLVAEAGA